MSTEEKIWSFLKQKGLNDYACAGVEGNLFCESRCKTNNLENAYEKKFGMSDDEYTAKVDSGEYSNFVHDCAGYGLAQWTYWSRKKGLYDLCKERKVSIADLDAQLDFLWYEMSRNGTLMNALMSSKSVYEASTIFMVVFENPADQSDSAKQKRANVSQRFYDQYVNKAISSSGNITTQMSGYDYIEITNGVGTYSKAKQGNCFFTIDGRVSNFQVREYACNDGSDEILIDGELVRRDQGLRDKFGVTTFNSAYRTPAYNAKVGGVPNSQHVYGKATDTVCRGATPLEVAMTAEAWGMGGIGLYTTFTHIDTRDGKSRWDNRSGKQVGVSTFFKTIRFGSTGEYVRICQRALNLKDDGIFWSGTEKAVKEFQSTHTDEMGNPLEVDGIVGTKTWIALMK
jgi:peptidoglycan hydrolase-like protein with peptidoglycan-binding domain